MEFGRRLMVLVSRWNAGILLKFDDASTVAALGTDSGNSNTFTPYNFSIANATGGAPPLGLAMVFHENTAIANLWDGQTSSYPGDFLAAALAMYIT